ncbi:MAG: hypothetical protein K2L66_01025 [Paramuribaculum sp.]|nr:hypothetical protein [Paramuribaculum sp.]
MSRFIRKSFIPSGVAFAALALGACDEGRIYPDGGSVEVATTEVRLEARLSGAESWPEGYTLSLAAFADGEDYALSSANIAPDATATDGASAGDAGLYTATLHNLPAWTIRDKCKYLIAVNCSPLTKTTVKNTLIDIAFRSYELMAKTNTVPDTEICDIVIRTDEIARYKAFNLKQIRQVYESGYRDTMNFLLANGFRRPGPAATELSTTDRQ